MLMHRGLRDLIWAVSVSAVLSDLLQEELFFPG